MVDIIDDPFCSCLNENLFNHYETFASDATLPWAHRSWRPSSPHRSGLPCSVSRTPLKGPPKFIFFSLLSTANRPSSPYLTKVGETLGESTSTTMPFIKARLISHTRGASQNTRREKSPDISERFFPCFPTFPSDKIRRGDV